MVNLQLKWVLRKIHVFKGGVRGESGVHGNSGSHDLDYPSLDKCVGRSSEKKWTRINKEQDERSKMRKESGTNALSKVNGKIVPTSSEILKIRETTINKINEVKNNSR